MDNLFSISLHQPKKQSAGIETIAVSLAMVFIAAMICTSICKADHTPDQNFPKLLIGDIMLWSTPGSARFRDMNYENVELNAALPMDMKTATGLLLNTKEAGGTARRVGSEGMSQMFLDAKEAGIDTICVDFFDGFRLGILMDLAEDARKSNSGISILPMMDRMEKDGPTFLRDIWKWEELRNHPNILKVDGRPVIIAYSAMQPSDVQRSISCAKEAGGSFIVLYCFNEIETAIGHKDQILPLDRMKIAADVADGIFYFSNVGPGISSDESGVLLPFMKFGRSISPPKLVGASVAPAYIGTTRVGNHISPRGTLLFRRNWLDVIDNNADFVHLCTLNDYSEATEMECSSNSTFSFIDMNRYFSTRWRTGKWPELKNPQAFLSYRKTVSSSEPMELELILLCPEITGKESPQQIALEYRALCKVRLNDAKREVILPEVLPELLPGHICWRFLRDEGWNEEGYGIPSAEITVKGKQLELTKGTLAPFAVFRSGKSLARKWVHVPLHRIRDVKASVIVRGSPGNMYPRTVRIEGLPWSEVSCGILERSSRALYTPLSQGILRDGFTENFVTGPDWAPMYYKDGWIKRCIVDEVDFYTSVIRMKDNTFIFPTPALVNPPKVDSATVVDYIMSNENGSLLDRGPLRRDMVLPKDSNCPAIARDSIDEPWYLRFSNTGDYLDMGELCLPPGPVSLELWIRLRTTENEQTIFESSSLNLSISQNDTLNLVRRNERREDVRLQGKEKLQVNFWYHITAVFTGSELKLYLNGKPDGEPIKTYGLESPERGIIGKADVDIARFRVLQRTMDNNEILECYNINVKDFVQAPSTVR